VLAGGITPSSLEVAGAAAGRASAAGVAGTALAAAVSEAPGEYILKFRSEANTVGL